MNGIDGCWYTRDRWSACIIGLFTFGIESTPILFSYCLFSRDPHYCRPRLILIAAQFTTNSIVRQIAGSVPYLSAMIQRKS
jgi:hypothetical protein